MPGVQTITQLMFGWSRSNPPDRERYELNLGEASSDFVTFSTEPGSGHTVAKPEPALIQRMVHELFVDSEGPRFVVLTGLFEKLNRVPAQVEAFQAEVIRQLSTALNLEPSTSTAYMNGLKSSRRMHFDGQQDSPILSIAYGPFKHIAPNSGVPRLADVNDWMETQRKNSWFWWFKRNVLWYEHPVFSTNPDSASPHFRMQQKLIDTHAIELEHLDLENDMPIVFVNNDKNTGVTHGATDIHLTHDDAERPIYRRYAKLKQND